MGRNKSHKSTVPHRPKLKKDPGVPKLPDLKIRQAEKQKARSPRPSRTDPDATMASEPTLSSLAVLASAIDRAQGSDPSTAASPAPKTKEQLRRRDVRALHTVIDDSDIVLLVLDARDPEGCRSRLVEEEVRRREGDGKRLVFVLNKIDLVPRENAQQWLRYLRHDTPTLPFRSAASNHQRSHLSCATAPALLRLLKAYKPSAVQNATVGVVGFPNVGKSSLINSLKRSKVCAVAAQPGHTKHLQTVQLERGLKIIDSPGVVFDDDEGGGQRQKSSVLLRNVVKVEDIEDPIAVVEEILSRTEHAALQRIYGLPEFTSTLEFLTMLALTSGRLHKGGTPDVLSAARTVLTDWNHQKIPYFSVAPTVHPSQVPSTIPGTTNGTDTTVIAPGAETVGQAQIRAEFSEPFTLAGLFGAADAGAFAPTDEVVMDNDDDGGGGDGDDDTMARGAAMVTDDGAVRLSVKRSRSPGVASEPGAGTTSRTPKRLRRAKDLVAYDETAAKSHPLSRKALKRDAKRARRAAMRVQQREAGDPGASMEVEVATLENTFMTGIER